MGNNLARAPAGLRRGGCVSEHRGWLNFSRRAGAVPAAASLRGWGASCEARGCFVVRTEGPHFLVGCRGAQACGAAQRECRDGQGGALSPAPTLCQ